MKLKKAAYYSSYHYLTAELKILNSLSSEGARRAGLQLQIPEANGDSIFEVYDLKGVCMGKFSSLDQLKRFAGKICIVVHNGVARKVKL